MRELREYTLIAACLVVVFGVGSIAAPTCALAGDWPQFLGPNRDGKSQETGLLGRFPPSGPTVTWRKDVGPGFSGPVVVGDQLVLFHELRNRNVVECFSARTGKSVWQADCSAGFMDGYGTGRGPRATPSIADGRVYVIDPRSTLVCFELKKGTEVWRRNLAQDYQIPDGFFGVSSSPVVEGDHLLVNIGSPDGAGLAAVDRKTGRTVWTATDDTASYSSPVCANLAGRRRALFFARSGLHCVDPLTGRELFFVRWRARMAASVNAATPLVTGDHVFISSSYNTGALLLHVTPEGCQKVWNSDASISAQYNTGILHDGYVYGIDGRQDHGNATLRCIELSTGKPQWTADGFGCASLVLADGKLYALTVEGVLHIIAPRADRFARLDQAAILTGTCRAHPALADGHFYARSDTELVRVRLIK